MSTLLKLHRVSEHFVTRWALVLFLQGIDKGYFQSFLQELRHGATNIASSDASQTACNTAFAAFRLTSSASTVLRLRTLDTSLAPSHALEVGKFHIKYTREELRWSFNEIAQQQGFAILLDATPSRYLFGIETELGNVTTNTLSLYEIFIGSIINARGRRTQRYCFKRFQCKN